MLLLKVLACIFFTLDFTHGSPKCVKDAAGVYKLNGKSCASTTRYNLSQRGGCGCGPTGSTNPFNWELDNFVAAVNLKFFDDNGDRQFCGHECGVCVKLTPTGGFVAGKGHSPHNLTPTIFLITNVCPTTGTDEWCKIGGKPGSNQTNSHGYEAHFVLQNHSNQISNLLGWDNPEVTWEVVTCPSDFQTKYHQCECFSAAG
ncbi:endoglucanase-like [Biomphalaria glabrata]|uniref:Endoglucanase-like n=1 Tax=Biomphalaria glabrata TaxID=6526 RepID=A0A9W3BNS1_BIOGL|nr:endoglucanase-like [Biomphalaria glabrata]